MRYDVAFTNGVIKSREKMLLGGKIEKMISGTYEEAISVLKESGFGGDLPEECSLEDYFRAEEVSVNDFVREYSPDKRISAFLLAEYDFHNLEAVIKGKFYGADEEKIIGAKGFYTVETLKNAVENESFGLLPLEMAQTVKQCAELFENGKADGFSVDCVCKKYLFEYLKKNAYSSVLKKILQCKADSVNVSSALRCGSVELFESSFVTGGSLQKQKIKETVWATKENGKTDFLDSPYLLGDNLSIESAFKDACTQREDGRPLTAFEKQADELPFDILRATRYDMKGAEPFIGYVLTRRAEIKNARLVTVCLNAGLSEKQIRVRLRKIWQ